MKFKFYSVPVRFVGRGRIKESELIQQILKIMEIPADAKTIPLGILTSSPRPIWANAREKLLKSKFNIQKLLSIVIIQTWKNTHLNIPCYR